MSRTMLELEAASMHLELLVDGAYQHLRKKHQVRALDWELGYSSSRQIRDWFRGQIGSKQHTITTGSKQYNTKPWFYLNPFRVTTCCDAKPKIQIQPS